MDPLGKAAYAFCKGTTNGFLLRVHASLWESIFIYLEENCFNGVLNARFAEGFVGLTLGFAR